mmetsp:Transcript_9999/g.24981  ORF Transcript_9999/g.24981 Transcript_9999/m.24981 type:complete len:80 (+) Transcript_9999:932-1171(+)
MHHPQHPQPCQPCLHGEAWAEHRSSAAAIAALITSIFSRGLGQVTMRGTQTPTTSITLWAARLQGGLHAVWSWVLAAAT